MIEIAHSLIDEMTDEQLQGLIMLLKNTISNRQLTAKLVRGVFSAYANK